MGKTYETDVLQIVAVVSDDFKAITSVRIGYHLHTAHGHSVITFRYQAPWIVRICQRLRAVTCLVALEASRCLCVTMSKTNKADVGTVLTVRSNNLETVIPVSTRQHRHTTHSDGVTLVGNHNPRVVRICKFLLSITTDFKFLKIARCCTPATSETDIAHSHEVCPVGGYHLKPATAINIREHLNTTHGNRVTRI